eukprot:TRINITY_DN8618_c0_g1_i1.p1 TRINITY_DN8618_c0_g1~~TRINITY_DN8618_c0_g1_i1.p1  ORF type:complete len:421 (+),score=50.53 TRINITY_DN8618_c0_g1_i1:205-1467(+)
MDESKKLKKWKNLVFIGIFLSNSSCYIGRKSFSSVAASLIKDSVISIEHAGLISSGMGLGYLLGKLFSGFFADIFPPDKFLNIIQISLGVITIIFCNISNIYIQIFLWVLNGISQGFVWTLCAKLLVEWYPENERGSKWALTSTSSMITTALIAIVSPLAYTRLGYYYFFIACASVNIIGTLIGFSLLKESPSHLKTEIVVESTKKNDHQSKKEKLKKNSETVLSKFKTTLSNIYVILFCITALMMYAVRYGITEWISLYTVEVKNFNFNQAGSLMFWLEIGGAVGTTSSGYLSDKYFDSKRGPINVYFTLIMVIAFPFIYFTSNYFLMSTILFIIGFALYGVQTFIGIHIGEILPKAYLSAALSVLGVCAGAGSIIGGFPIGWIIENFEWTHYHIFIYINIILCLICLFPTLNVKTKID